MAITTIPLEIRSLVYNLLPQKDIATVRLTCQKWRKEINELMVIRWELIQKHFNFILQHQPPMYLIDIASWIQLPNTPDHFVKLHKLFSLILGPPSLPFLVEPSDLYLCAKKLQQIHEFSLNIICTTKFDENLLNMTNIDENSAEKRRRLLVDPGKSAKWDEVKLKIGISQEPSYTHFIIPHAVTYLENLESLEIAANLLFLPTNIGALTNLQELDLDRNHLDRLPDSLEYLKSLKALFLSKNNFNRFPEVILKLKRLEELSMHSNHLTSFPDLTSLTNLISLDFSSNQISFIPDDFIRNLNHLQQLYIEDNQLHAFPETIVSLTALSTFEADENPVFFIPEKILAKFDEAPFTNSFLIQQHKRKLDYPATSELGKLYQAILKGENDEALKKLYFDLSEDDKQLIKEIWTEKNRSKTCDEEILFSDLKRFSEAVEESIFNKWDDFAEQSDRESTLQLLEEQLEKVETAVFDGVGNRDSELHNCPPLLADTLANNA